VSPDTKAFLHRLEVVSSITTIESEPHEPVSDFLHPNALVAHRLKPYENHADRLLAAKALPPETKLTELSSLSSPIVRPLVEAVGKVFVALGRSPTPAVTTEGIQNRP
jgi:hypothetical protein